MCTTWSEKNDQLTHVRIALWQSEQWSWVEPHPCSPPKGPRPLGSSGASAIPNSVGTTQIVEEQRSNRVKIACNAWRGCD